MKHKEEIIRWANCPDGTKVWNKKDGFEWRTSEEPLWLIHHEYIVDDEYSEIRKAQAEGETILYYGKEVPYALKFNSGIDSYSIKKEFVPVLKRSKETGKIFCFTSETTGTNIETCKARNTLYEVNSDKWEDI